MKRIIGQLLLFAIIIIYGTNLGDVFVEDNGSTKVPPRAVNAMFPYLYWVVICVIVLYFIVQNTVSKYPIKFIIFIFAVVTFLGSGILIGIEHNLKQYDGMHAGLEEATALINDNDYDGALNILRETRDNRFSEYSLNDSLLNIVFEHKLADARNHISLAILNMNNKDYQKSVNNADYAMKSLLDIDGEWETGDLIGQAESIYNRAVRERDWLRVNDNSLSKAKNENIEKGVSADKKKQRTRDSEATNTNEGTITTGNGVGVETNKRVDDRKYWINTNSSARHNRSCRYYGNTKRGYYTAQKSGKACGICGG